MSTTKQPRRPRADWFIVLITATVFWPSSAPADRLIDLLQVLPGLAT